VQEKNVMLAKIVGSSLIHILKFALFEKGGIFANFFKAPMFAKTLQKRKSLKFAQKVVYFFETFLDISCIFVSKTVVFSRISRIFGRVASMFAKYYNSRKKGT